eukprot:1074362-Pyramimonas_sp.AAC.1
MLPDANDRLPALVAFDYGQAFPSIAQLWIFLTLKSLNTPAPLRLFLEMIYQFVLCYGRIGSEC